MDAKVKGLLRFLLDIKDFKEYNEVKPLAAGRRTKG
jgi:hypothetical protein